MTHQFMHEHIVQSSIISKITNKSSNIYVSTSKNTVMEKKSDANDNNDRGTASTSIVMYMK